MLDQQQSKLGRNIARTRKHSAKVEQCLTKIEKADGCARAWELRAQIERGEISLNELRRR